MNSDFIEEGYPVRNELDVDILMHREVHFGGSFPIMRHYYEQRGKGIRSEFELRDIERLEEFEKVSKQNLAILLLSGPEAEKIAKAKKAYKKLRDLYEKEEKEKSFPLLIADLILSEEENPQEEINAIVKEKGAIVPSLLELLRSENFYDPLFPGYGQAPLLAAKCLGLIGDKRAMIALFETIGEEDIFNEDIILDALKLIGEPAKEFLLHIVRARPITFDNERAAIALLSFKEDEEVGKQCVLLLLEPDVRKDLVLSTYLALACEGLKDPLLRQKFLEIASDPKTSPSLAQDIIAVSHQWK